MTAPFDALIIGAGWSGLTCALRLSQAGKRVICLEARSRLGGRAFTHSWNDETPMSNNERTVKVEDGISKSSSSSSANVHLVDFGCSYIHGYNEGNPVKEIAKRYNVEVFTAKPTTTQIIGPEGVLSSSLSEQLQDNLQGAQSTAKEHAKQLRTSSFSEIGKKSLGDALFDENDSPLFKGLQGEKERSLAISLARSMHIPLGTEIENVALEYFGYERAFGGTDGLPEGGFSHLINCLAEEVKEAGGQIRTGEEVIKVVQNDDGSNASSVRVITRSSNQTSSQEAQYVARSAIVTIPLAVLKTKHNDLFQPPLDAERQTIIARTNVGNLNKVLLTYSAPWWPKDVGTFFVLPSQSNKYSSSSTPSNLHQLFSSTTLIISSLCAPAGLPQRMTTPSLLIMIGGQHGKWLEAYDRIEVAEALHDYLFERIIAKSKADEKIAAKKSLQHTFYSRWARQPYTGGATTTPIVLGSSPNDLNILASPAWNHSLFFAGEHCELNHRGSIAGAVVSAQTASEAVLKRLNESAHI